MKTWKQGIFGILGIFALLFAFIACDNGETHTHEWEWKVTTPASYNTNGLETETCNCGATNGTRPIAHPTPTEFTVSFDFQNPNDSTIRYNVTIKDERTVCGSQNLEQLGIKTIIEQEIQGAFNNENTTNPQKTRFRNVFGTSNNGGATIIVNNPTTPYKIKATDSSAIYFHVNYLTSSPADIQQNIINAVVAMNPTSPNLPFNVE